MVVEMHAKSPDGKTTFKQTAKFTFNPPKGFDMEFLSGPMVGTKHTHTYTPMGDKTKVEVAGEEEKHIVNTMLDRIVRHSSISTLSADAVSRSIDDMGHGFVPNTAFVPLTFHSALLLQRDPSIHVSYGLGKDRGSYLEFGSWKLRLYWSNKYVPFTKLIFVDRRNGEWLVKPASDKRWLNIEITPVATSVDVTVRTIMRCEISRPELGLILDVSEK
jgi:hypothetical protein